MELAIRVPFVTLTAAVFFAFLFEVLSFGDFLVFDCAAGSQLAPGGLETALTDSVGTDSEAGQQLLDFFALTRRAGRWG